MMFAPVAIAQLTARPPPDSTSRHDIDAHLDVGDDVLVREKAWAGTADPAAIDSGRDAQLGSPSQPTDIALEEGRGRHAQLQELAQR